MPSDSPPSNCTPSDKVHFVLMHVCRSKCAQWLFSGHWNGSLNIWNVGYSLSRLYDDTLLPTIPREVPVAVGVRYQIGPGGKPYKCLRGECLHVGGLTSILPQPKIDNDNSTEMEMDIFTTGKDACVQQHRFRTVLHGEGARRDIDVQFDKLGEFDPVARVGGKGKAPRVFCTLLSLTCVNQTDAGHILGVPVAVEMGHFTEHLLLVAARDIVHVLKIQTLAESVLALQQNAHYSPLTFVHTAISQPISPPIAAALASDNTVTVLSLPSATSSQTVTPCLPSASISALIVHEHYIILGWSTGAVHVYDNLKFVGSAQDPTFTTSVTSIVVMNIPVWKARKPLAHESMWGGKLRSSKALAPLPRTNDAEAGATNHSRHDLIRLSIGTTCIFAASGDGFVLAWRLPSFQRYCDAAVVTETQWRHDCSAVVAEATVTWRGHSATIQSLLPFSIGENHHALVSIASNGLIKVWSVNPMADAAPPLLSQYAVPSRANGAVTATCLLEQDDHIHLFVCGFENGSIAIHQVDSHIQGARVPADPHQRRVSCIRSVPHPGQLNPPSNIVMHCSFASASFDGHVIVYFEFHGPVLDAFVHDESLIVTLPNELCRVKYVSSLRAATFGEKPARHLHPITLPTETHGATAETAMANESRLQHIECHIAIHDRDKSLPEACPDSLSLAYPATQSPSDHDVMAEAIREFLASTHSEHQFDDEHARLAQFLSSNHLLPASKLTWAQAVDALTWCNTAPSTSSAAAVHRRYDAMGQTKRLVPPKFVANVLDASDAKAIRGNVEMHAFLVEWISEWEATSVAFARSERDLFGPRTMASMADELTKLRTLLECFIYYDRRRDGCVDHHTFGTIILGMLALWPPVDDACDVAEHIQGLVNRYQDHERDGAVCYLDMFSLLYVVALKAHKYLPFPDILDFSWGYKLELDDAYRGNVVAFMQNYMFQEPPAGVLDVGKLNGGSSQSWHRHSTGTFHWKHTVVAGPDAVDSALRMEHLAVHVGHPALRERAEQHDAKPSKHDVPPGPYIPGTRATAAIMAIKVCVTSFSNHVSIGTSRTLTSRDDPFVPTMDTVKSMDLAGAVADSQDDGSVGAQVLSCDVAPVGEVISPHLDKSDDVVTSGVAEAPSVGGFHPDSTRVDSDHDDDVQLVDVDAYIPADDLHTHAPQSVRTP
ncbi:hypothetical protein DYB32_008511 [Aphanomyces invadans]|uniref:EF-hand domain-containing protein n=1 Tax=Aphanomyces invadans TaxID=157072 RepID=A0A3R6VRY5_9STRA|nr:hypothetical protein DYB32_008511 [Aphanomyces invadans]